MGRAGRARSLGGGRASVGRGSAGHRPDRQRIPAAPLSHFDGPKPDLRRLGAVVCRKRRRRSQAHEPHPRGQRAGPDVPGRAGRELLRYVPVSPPEQDPALDRHGRSRLGRSRRKCAGSRGRVYRDRLSRSLRRALRHGGRPAERRGCAHGDGGESEVEDLADLQVRHGAVGGRHLLAVQLRDRHQDGLLAHGGARSRSAGQRQRSPARRHRAAARHADEPYERARHSLADAGHEPDHQWLS